jgi:hypothetical protein
MSSEDTANTIKRRLRSAGENFAQHTLETAKDAAKGLENTHAAYIYPIQVLPLFNFTDISLGNILLPNPPGAAQTLLRFGCNVRCHRRRHCGRDMFLRLSTSGTRNKSSN